MKYIKKRQENLLNEAILYYLDSFKEINKELLKRPGIVGKIATVLSQTEGVDIKSDMSFIGPGEKGYLNYSSSVVVNNNFEEDVLANYQKHMDAFAKSPVKIGKFINVLAPNIFTPSEIEQYVRSFMNATENNLEEFMLFSGKDIITYYNENSYYDTTKRGTLGNSCMRYAECADYLKILVDSPDKCQLLVLMDVESQKILGRALIWKVEGTSEFDVLMDRIYYTDVSEVSKFRKYATDHGYGYKTHDSHSSHRFVTFNGKEGYYQLSVKLTPPTNQIGVYNYDHFPYLDTFSRYNFINQVLYNDANVFAEDCIVLMHELGEFLDADSDPDDKDKDGED